MSIVAAERFVPSMTYSVSPCAAASSPSASHPLLLASLGGLLELELL